MAKAKSPSSPISPSIPKNELEEIQKYATKFNLLKRLKTETQKVNPTSSPKRPYYNPSLQYIFKQTTEEGESLLHIAAKENNVDMVKLLIKAIKISAPQEMKDFLNKQNNSGETALHLVSHLPGSEEVTKLLVLAGTDLEITNSDGHSALSKAVFHNNEAASILFEKASPAFLNRRNIVDKTVLDYATLNNNRNIISRLIEAGADLTPNKRGDNSLHIALRHHELREAAFTIINSPNLNSDRLNEINQYEGNPLHIAIMNNDEEMVKALCARNVDKDVPDKSGKTALHLAIQKKYWDGAEYLISNGANFKAENRNDETPLHIIAAKKPVIEDERHLEVTRFLLEAANFNPEFINKQNRTGKTALHFAYQVGNFEMAEYLISLGANPEIQDRQGNLPQDYKDYSLFSPTEISSPLSARERAIAASEDLKKRRAQFRPIIIENFMTNEDSISIASSNEDEIIGILREPSENFDENESQISEIEEKIFEILKNEIQKLIDKEEFKDAKEIIINSMKDGIEFDEIDNDRSVLKNLVMTGNHKMVRFLIEDAGASPTKEDSEGLNMLDYYTSYYTLHPKEEFTSDTEFLKEILIKDTVERMPDSTSVGSKSSGSSSLESRLRKDRTRIKTFLADKNFDAIKAVIKKSMGEGIDFDDIDSDRSILHSLIRSENAEIVKFLINEVGADVTKTDSENKNASQIATECLEQNIQKGKDFSALGDITRTLQRSRISKAAPPTLSPSPSPKSSSASSSKSSGSTSNSRI